MSPVAFDVAIVGGGPAGCAAAISLAQAGWQVILFEARSYPHDKLCGEFLSPGAVVLLERLGVTPRLRSLGPPLIQEASVRAPDGTSWQTRFPRAAWGLTRSALDAAMAWHARGLGAQVRESATVANIAGTFGGGFELTVQEEGGRRTVRARAVIAAHGRRGALDRVLGRPFLRQHQPYVALKAHFQGPALPHRLDLHGFPGGYCGMSEVEGNLTNVCLLVHEQVFRRTRCPGSAPAAAFIDWMQEQNPALRRWLQQAERVDKEWLSIAQVPFLDKGPATGDVLFAGDAAGVIAPLAGDGIAMALQSGEMAALQVAMFLQGRAAPAGVAAQYGAAWRRTFGRRLRLGAALQVLMLRPWLLSLSLRLLATIPGLGRYVFEGTRDRRLLAGSVKEIIQ